MTWFFKLYLEEPSRLVSEDARVHGYSKCFVSLCHCSGVFPLHDHSFSYYWYTMNCCALTTILYLDKACMGESTIPMTFHSRLKENNINNQANFHFSAQWYKTFRVTLNSCIFRYLRPLDRYRKIHSFKDPLNITSNIERKLNEVRRKNLCFGMNSLK